MRPVHDDADGGRRRLRQTVSRPVKDERFRKSLKLADGPDVKGEGATIKVALNKSAARPLATRGHAYRRSCTSHQDRP